ncbi:oxidoreductase C-terminal domain-containing protein [Mycolicibacterium doricum]|uniref:oxidoreductase C-terminal domain-containing protein n=1 Tax=Mycolicibacterium doricum TaxID=126673 RepID=UPI0013D0DE74|nr:hypothetical protein [Mycolicibacterium doricum]
MIEGISGPPPTGEGAVGVGTTETACPPAATGLSRGSDRVAIRGEPDTTSFAAFYWRDGRIPAAVSLDWVLPLSAIQPKSATLVALTAKGLK